MRGIDKIRMVIHEGCMGHDCSIACSIASFHLTSSMTTSHSRAPRAWLSEIYFHNPAIIRHFLIPCLYSTANYRPRRVLCLLRPLRAVLLGQTQGCHTKLQATVVQQFFSSFLSFVISLLYRRRSHAHAHPNRSCLNPQHTLSPSRIPHSRLRRLADRRNKRGFTIHCRHRNPNRRRSNPI